MRTLGLVVLVGALAVGAWADTAEETDMFGGAATPEASATQTRPTRQSSTATGAALSPSPKGEGLGGEELVPSDSNQTSFSKGETKEDPLQIGGTFYQQYNATSKEGENLGDTSLSAPLQVDVFLDGRPNDRVRTYVLGRLIYDSTKDQYGFDTSGKKTPYIPSASAVTYTVTPLPKNPQVVLDQAWVKWDIERKAFVSLGKQHVKWGTGRIWNPTDSLNPQRRDPLQPYDLRLGADLLSVQVPWEAQSANLYAMALLNNPDPASSLQQNGGAFRAEGIVFGAEIGLDAVTRAGLNPVYGADLSTGLGPIDFYAEAALLTGYSLPTYQFLNKPGVGFVLSSLTSTSQSVYAINPLDGHALQVSTGLNYTFAYAANRTATLGGEYLYNELGVSDANLYPVLLYLGRYTPLYVGKHYGAIYLSAEGLDSGKKTSYNISTLENLVDASFESRLDFNWLLLDYLSFGANVSVHYGMEGGEFNYAFDGGNFAPGVHSSRTPVEGGVSLRMGF